jgi:hypothetical protein
MEIECAPRGTVSVAFFHFAGVLPRVFPQVIGEAAAG